MANGCGPTSSTWAANFTLSVNGQTRAGADRRRRAASTSPATAASLGRGGLEGQCGERRLRRHEKRRDSSTRRFRTSRASRSSRCSRTAARATSGDVARIYLGSVSNVPGFPTLDATQPGSGACRTAGAAAAVRYQIARPHRRTHGRWSCRRTCSGRTPASTSAAASICGSNRR